MAASWIEYLEGGDAMTDLDIYQPPAQIEQYQARMVMTPEAARALDEQVRLCTRAVLREGTDFGIIPGAGGRKVLFKPGAEKLLQWFGFGFTCDRTDLEVDEDGQKQGVTYRCTITKQLPEGRIAAVTTCEGYAGYDELKFFKPVSDTERHKAEARERGWAKKDGRLGRPDQAEEHHRLPGSVEHASSRWRRNGPSSAPPSPPPPPPGYSARKRRRGLWPRTAACPPTSC